MPTSSYSLSSAAASDASCRPKKKRLSAQLSRLMGRVSSEDSPRRRGISEDGNIIAGARMTNNNMSKAAAWMWHTRGIGEASVLPTKQRPVVNARNLNTRSSCSHHEEASTPELNTRKLQPSRFKAEANCMPRSAPADQLRHTSSSAHECHESQASHDSLEGKHEKRRPSTFLYDEFELSCLQEMLENKLSAQQQLVSHEIIPYPRPISPLPSSVPSRQMNRLSAIQKLFKRLYTTIQNSSRNSSVNPAPSGLGPRKVGSVEHVIHHHHHHYHHHNSSLDLPAHESQSAPTSHLQGRRRRANSESCSGTGLPSCR